MQSLLLLIVLMAALPEEPAPPGPRLPSPHPDGAALEQAVLDATLAFLREDLKAARPALDRMDAGCRRMREDDVEAHGSELVAYDRAFHSALDLSREMATAGNMQRSWEQFMWVTKGCRGCHAIARAGPPPPKARAH